MKLVRQLRASSYGTGIHLQTTTRKAVRKIVIMVTLVSVVAVFMCLMEFVAFIGDVSNTSVYFQVVALIGKALATWIYIFGLCLLFGPVSGLKTYVKNIINTINA